MSAHAPIGSTESNSEAGTTLLELLLALSLVAVMLDDLWLIQLRQARLGNSHRVEDQSSLIRCSRCCVSCCRRRARPK